MDDVTIIGSVIQGQTLTAQDSLTISSSWYSDGYPISYSWFSDGIAIPGAKTDTLTLTQAEVDKRISVDVVFLMNFFPRPTWNGGLIGMPNPFIYASSIQTQPVENINDIPTGSVVINGIAKQGQILTASNTLEDVDGVGLISYEWKANDTTIGTGGSYTLTQAEIGKTIVVAAYYVDGQATAESVISTPTPIVVDSVTGLNKTGTPAADILTGSVGIDTLAGGLGNDTYIIDTLTDVVTELPNQGTDLIKSQISYSLADTDGDGSNGGNIENLMLIGTAAISATGNTLNNILYTNTGNNVVDGGPGMDIVSYLYGASAGVTVNLTNTTAQITGGSGSDTLLNIENITGSNYKDILIGNGAENRLNGGLGNDVLTGGIGKDTFFFNTVLGISNIDRLTDFKPIDDTIQLENAIFTKFTTNGAIANDSFKIGTAAMDSNDYLIYNSTTGALSYDADGNSAIASQQFAILPVGLALTASDFVIV